MSIIKIAIIDDEKEILDMLERFLLRKGQFEVTTYHTPLEALNSLDAETDVVLLDIMMPQKNGLELLPILCEKSPRLKVIMMTAYSTLDKVLEAHKHGAADYIMKPFESLDKLETKIKEVAAQP